MPKLLVFGLLFLPCAARSQTTPADPKRAAQYLADSAAGLKTLQTWYAEDTGLWKTTNWWNAANALTMLTDYSRLTDTPDFRAVMANTFDRNSQKHFLNDYYDDQGWWALGWAGAYEVTHEARYLEMAELIFNDMAGGWDETCGGGIWWKKPKQYKNAIANELFLSVAARLASLTQDAAKRARYLDWAQREWKWFAASGMINSDNLVNDGLDASCHNNRRNTWSYNQGVILGGLATLAKVSGDAKPLEAAQSIALSAIARLTDSDGVLHDSCEPARCGNDAPQFKGIFSRNLAILNAAAPVPGFRAFLRRNAESIWKNRDADGRFGVVWSGPSDLKTAATQVSALDNLVAAAGAECAASNRASFQACQGERPPAILLANDRLELTIQATGGTFTKLLLRDGEPVSPLASIGHFLALDGFGAPSPQEAASGMPFHGEASKQVVKLIASQDSGPVRSRVFQLSLPLAQETLTRTIEMVEGENVVYVTSDLESGIAVDRPLSWAEHATIGPPFLEKGQTVVDMPALSCRVRPFKPGPIPGRLVYERDFQWPMAPTKDNGQADLRLVPPENDLDLASCQMDPKRKLAYVTALHLSKRLLFGYVFRQQDYPWLMSWMNYTGDNRAARGMEFSTQPFDISHQETVAMNPLFGTPTFRWLPARAKLQTRFLFFYVRVPEGFTRIDNVTWEDGKLTILDRSGLRLVLPATRGW